MHASRCVIALMPVALSVSGLGGCDKLSSTTIVRTLEDGTRNDKSWSRTWKDRARFKCLRQHQRQLQDRGVHAAIARTLPARRAW